MAAELKLQAPPPKVTTEFTDSLDRRAAAWLKEYQSLHSSKDKANMLVAESKENLRAVQQHHANLTSKLQPPGMTIRDRLNGISVFGVKPFGFLGASPQAAAHQRLKHEIGQSAKVMQEAADHYKSTSKNASRIYDKMKSHFEAEVNEVRKRAVEQAREHSRQQSGNKEEQDGKWLAGRQQFEQSLLEQAQKLDQARKELGAVESKYGADLSAQDRAALAQAQTQLGSQAMLLRSASSGVVSATRGMNRAQGFVPPGNYQDMLKRSHMQQQKAQDLTQGIPLQVQMQQQQQQQEQQRQQQAQSQRSTHSFRPSMS